MTTEVGRPYGGRVRKPLSPPQAPGTVFPPLAPRGLLRTSAGLFTGLLGLARAPRGARKRRPTGGAADARVSASSGPAGRDRLRSGPAVFRSPGGQEPLAHQRREGPAKVGVFVPVALVWVTSTSHLRGGDQYSLRVKCSKFGRRRRAHRQTPGIWKSGSRNALSCKSAHGKISTPWRRPLTSM